MGRARVTAFLYSKISFIIHVLYLRMHSNFISFVIIVIYIYEYTCTVQYSEQLHMTRTCRVRVHYTILYKYNTVYCNCKIRVYSCSCTSKLKNCTICSNNLEIFLRNTATDYYLFRMFYIVIKIKKYKFFSHFQ